MALSAYGVVAAFQPSHEFGRVLAAYGGVFIVGSLLWGVERRRTPKGGAPSLRPKVDAPGRP